MIGPTVLGVGTILVSSMFAVLKSLNSVNPVIRASWRLQTTFLALAAPSTLLLYLDARKKHDSHIQCVRANRAILSLLPMATIWSGCGYALYNVGLCIALAKTSLLRASVLSQCAPLFIVLYNMARIRYYRSRSHLAKTGNGDSQEEVHWKHALGVVLTVVGTGIYVSSMTSADADATGIITGKTSPTIFSRHGESSASDIDFRSHLIGDFAAAAASAGYATYISCGRQARRVVPVYVHLPGCVFVAMVLISVCAITMTATMNVSDVISLSASVVAPDATILTNRSDNDFCSSLFGWTCREYLPRSIFLGVVCGAIAVGMINWSLNHVSALQAAAANSAEPIAASIIGIVFFAEPLPNFTAILAASVIVIAMVLCSTDATTSGKTKNKSGDEDGDAADTLREQSAICDETTPSKGKKVISARARKSLPETC